jgi:hypothetical protein
VLCFFIYSKSGERTYIYICMCVMCFHIFQVRRANVHIYMYVCYVFSYIPSQESERTYIYVCVLCMCVMCFHISYVLRFSIGFVFTVWCLKFFFLYCKQCVICNCIIGIACIFAIVI